MPLGDASISMSVHLYPRQCWCPWFIKVVY